MLDAVSENITTRNSMNLFLYLHARLILSYIEWIWGDGSGTKERGEKVCGYG
jgi:hypothetical protein